MAAATTAAPAAGAAAAATTHVAGTAATPQQAAAEAVAAVDAATTTGGVDDHNFWAVLVGGEAPGASHHGSHVSAEYVGQAYSALKARLGGRARIVVVCNIGEVAAWYDTKADLSKPLWQRKRAHFLQACGELLHDGGPDYDGDLCTPATVQRVLRGLAGPRHPKVVSIHPSAPGRVFVAVYSHGNHPPDTPLDAQVKDRLQPAVVLPRNELWYAHFAYPSAPADIEALRRQRVRTTTRIIDGSAGVGTVVAGAIPAPVAADAKQPTAAAATADSKQQPALAAAAGSDHSAHAHTVYDDGTVVCGSEPILRLDGRGSYTLDEHTRFPLGAGYEEVPRPGTMYTDYLLHWQQWFVALRHLVASGVTQIVTLHQHCKSGGFLKFHTNRHLCDHYGVDEWPVYAMATAGECQGALSDFYRLFFVHTAQEFAKPTTATAATASAAADGKSADAKAKASAANAKGKEKDEGPLTFRQLFKKVEREYWRLNDAAAEQNELIGDHDRKWFCLGEVEHSEPPLPPVPPLVTATLANATATANAASTAAAAATAASQPHGHVHGHKSHHSGHGHHQRHHHKHRKTAGTARARVGDTLVHHFFPTAAQLARTLHHFPAPAPESVDESKLVLPPPPDAAALAALHAKGPNFAATPAGVVLPKPQQPGKIRD